jgi:hypothetical protein
MASPFKVNRISGIVDEWPASAIAQLSVPFQLYCPIGVFTTFTTIKKYYRETPMHKRFW